MMILTDKGEIRVSETNDEILTFDVSDDALERAAPIIGGVASVVTLNFATAIIGIAPARYDARSLNHSSWRPIAANIAKLPELLSRHKTWGVR